MVVKVLEVALLLDSADVDLTGRTNETWRIPNQSSVVIAVRSSLSLSFAEWVCVVS